MVIWLYNMHVLMYFMDWLRTTQHKPCWVGASSNTATKANLPYTVEATCNSPITRAPTDRTLYLPCADEAP